jgi:transposase InsO family protein
MKNEPQTSPAQALALERFAFITPIQELLRQGFPLSVALEQVSLRPLTLPDGSQRLRARRTIEDWGYDYQHGGFAALSPKERTDKGQPLGGATKCFEAPFVHDLWMTDFSPGPYLQPAQGGKALPTFLCVIIDDHSRLIPYAAYRYLRADTQAFHQTLKEAVRRRGLPAKLYTDQGGPFTNDHTRIVCANLGIRLLHAKPDHAWSKGKAEPVIFTIQQDFEAGLRLAGCAARSTAAHSPKCQPSVQRGWWDHRCPRPRFPQVLRPQNGCGRQRAARSNRSDRYEFRFALRGLTR